MQTVGWDLQSWTRGEWNEMTGDELLNEIDTSLFIETVWWRGYKATGGEMKRLLIAYEHLPTKWQLVLSERFSAPDGHTLKEIAASMDMTREGIRQIEERALGALREAVGSPNPPVDKRSEASRPIGRPRPIEIDPNGRNVSDGRGDREEAS
jgi:hypothetical protein